FFFCYAVTHQRDLYSFPTRRSSDLGGVEGVMIHDQSGAGRSLLLYDLLMVAVVALAPSVAPLPARAAASPVHAAAAGTGGGTWTDRKSTRLNSSHEWISYAVFCLKK